MMNPIFSILLLYHRHYPGPCKSVLAENIDAVRTYERPINILMAVSLFYCAFSLIRGVVR